MQFNDNNEVIVEVEQRAVLVGLDTSRRNEVLSMENSMIELKELVQAAGAVVLHSTVQKRPKVDSALYIGKGKADEIKNICHMLDANLVVFNEELSGAQIRNLEEKLEVTVLDRTALILDIFAQRAKSKEGKLQVELAQLRYRLPRLVGLGRSLSRTGAGIGARGPGETKLEMDKRHILERIDEIRKQINEIKKNRLVQRKQRQKNEIPIVALVGYTNAGKSTLMNKILEVCNQDIEKSVFAKDMLFATLDTTNRKIILPSKDEFILIDTVGFVSKLPHDLVEAFKATLEEVQEADLLIHLVDSTNEDYEGQMRVTNSVLKDLDVEDKKNLLVYNKVDMLEENNIIINDEDTIAISAKTELGLNELIEKIKEKIFSNMVEVELLIPYDKGGILSYLCDKTNVSNQEYTENGTQVRTRLDKIDYNKYKEYII